MPHHKLDEPRNTRGSTRQVTPQSIQRLNLNIRKREQLGVELNFPVSALLASGARLVSAYSLTPYMPQLIALGSLYFGQSLFPNGIGFTRKHYSYEYTQEHCLTGEQILSINREMETLIEKQTSRKKKQLYLSVFLPTVLSLLNISAQYLGFNPERPTALAKFISGFSGILLDLTVFTKMYGWYANYNLPTQLIVFKGKLNRLGALQADRWQKISENEKERGEAMFLLNLVGDNKLWVQIDRGIKNNRLIEVSKQNYLMVLHECLKIMKAPVFVGANKNICLGFLHLSDGLVEQFRKKLQVCLEGINQVEERKEQLNKFLPSIDPHNGWDCRHEIRYGMLVRSTFFIKTAQLKDKNNALREKLERIEGQFIILQGEEITLKYIPAIPDEVTAVSLKNLSKKVADTFKSYCIRQREQKQSAHDVKPKTKEVKDRKKRERSEELAKQQVDKKSSLGSATTNGFFSAAMKKSEAPAMDSEQQSGEKPLTNTLPNP